MIAKPAGFFKSNPCLLLIFDAWCIKIDVFCVFGIVFGSVSMDLIYSMLNLMIFD